MKIFEILMRLRQICCHPILFKSITKFSSVQDFPAELKKWLKKRIEERNDVDNHARFELVMEGE
jgi:SNF2 family DNA or RNA helicase